MTNINVPNAVQILVVEPVSVAYHANNNCFIRTDKLMYQNSYTGDLTETVLLTTSASSGRCWRVGYQQPQDAAAVEDWRYKQ